MVQSLSKSLNKTWTYMYGGMHPVYVEDVDGEEIENLVSTVKEQVGTVHFLDMEILQSTPGV